MKPFTYERARIARRGRGRGRAQPGRQVHRRRHQPARPDEAADRDADAPGRRQRPRRSTGSSRRPTAACASARWCATPTWPPTSACGATTACCRARCWPAPRASCATRRPRPATCCSARAAPTSTTPTSRATSASPAAAARAHRRLQPPARGRRRRARPASPRTRATWRWRCACSTRRSRRCGPTARARVIPIADFHRLPGDTPHIETALERGELITAVTLPRPVGGTHIYRKVRDRASYAFALVSVAAIVQRDGIGPRGAGRRGAQAVARRGGRGRSCRAAPRPSPAQLLAGAQPTARERLQAAAGRAHARRGAGRSEELSHEVRHPRHHQSDRPAQGRRQARPTASTAR